MGEKIGIAGAGLVGSLWAVYLAQKGYTVDVYESRPDMRKVAMPAGRSINLALSDRGWKALEQVGLVEEVNELAIPMYGRMIHDENGHTEFMPYGKGNQAIYSVSRGELNKLMMDKAEAHEPVNMYFEQRCNGVDIQQPAFELVDKNSEKPYEAHCDRVFGTDGAFSKVRESLMKTKRFNYSQEFLEHGYKELTIPAGENGEWQMYKNALHIWPRNSFMLIALPNLDGSYTCTLFLAFEGEQSFNQMQTEADVNRFFETYFPDAKALMPNLTEYFFNNPTDALVTIRCNPWYFEDKVCILGDAAHAIVPFYGQGMNAGFEDCRLLNETINQYEGGWGKIFKNFSKNRVPDANAIADLALHNFVEMRDLVADPHFQKKRELSRKIEDLIPDQWHPLYAMVTFSHQPYSEALSNGKKQDEILEKILEKHDYDTLIHDEEQLKKVLNPYIKEQLKA